MTVGNDVLGGVESNASIQRYWPGAFPDVGMMLGNPNQCHDSEAPK